MKCCSKCRELKPASEFNQDKNTKDNLCSWCKTCRRKYREANREKTAEYDREYNKANRKKVAERTRKWHKANPGYNREYNRKRRNEDIQYKLAGNLRSRLYDAIKGGAKNGSAVSDLGCSIGELKIYLEARFDDGMSWNNWSLDGWHVDHRQPLSSFDLTDREQLKKACHYTNLQPLWAKDNLSKHDKILVTGGRT